MSLDRKAQPPVAKKDEEFEIVMHGITRNDEYAWMKDENWQEMFAKPEILQPEIRRYLEAENAYTDAVTATTKDLQAELFEELKGRMPQDDASAPTKEGDYFYYHRFEEGKQYPIYCRRFKSLEAKEQIIFDVNGAAKNHDYFKVRTVAVSPDHQKLAYTVDTNGSEIYILHVFDIKTRGYITEGHQGVSPSLAWANDSETLYYLTVDKPPRANKLWRHKIGSAQEEDKLLHEEKDDSFFPGLTKTSDKKFILLQSSAHTTTETHYLDADDPKAYLEIFAPRVKDEEYTVDHGNGQFFIHTNRDALDFKIMTCATKETSRFKWREFIPYEAGKMIKSMAVFETYFVRLEQVKALPQLIVQNFESGLEYMIDAADAAYDFTLIGSREFKTKTLRFGYTSPSTPMQIIDYNMSDKTDRLVKEQIIPSGHNPEDYIVERDMAETADGVDVPITILRHKDTPLDGLSPLWLYGYGSYGSSMPAYFSHSRLTLVNRGFIFAIAHIRGGMECGYQWYLDGKYTKKMNTFTDFIDCAEHLIQKGYTTAGNIYAEGRSAGGLLMGAVTNMRPDLWKLVHAGVPFVDVLNTMSDEELPLTPGEWPEWGNPIVSKIDYNRIESYSPYDQVVEKDYPNILVTAGLTDPRVTYWEPAKWIAKLRDKKTDDNLVIMKMEMGMGHGGASGRFDMLKEYAFEYAVVLELFKYQEEIEEDPDVIIEKEGDDEPSSDEDDQPPSSFKTTGKSAF